MLQDMLNQLQERELDRLEARRLELTEKVYPNLPAIIKRTSELTNIPDEELVQACVYAAWHYQSLEWHDVLDIIRSFYLARKNIEEKKKS
jgi:hypothetical protein